MPYCIAHVVVAETSKCFSHLQLLSPPSSMATDLWWSLSKMKLQKMASVQGFFFFFQSLALLLMLDYIFHAQIPKILIFNRKRRNNLDSSSPFNAAWFHNPILVHRWLPGSRNQ